MSDYLDMDCKNCGRHRIGEDGICENCNYDNFLNEYHIPLLGCAEHGAGTCKNEYIFEKYRNSFAGFVKKNKAMASDLENLRIAKCSDQELIKTNELLRERAEKAEAELAFLRKQTRWERFSDEFPQDNQTVYVLDKFQNTCLWTFHRSLNIDPTFIYWRSVDLTTEVKNESR